MKTRKIGGVYLGELLFGTGILFGFMAIMVLVVNAAYPAWM